jgi:hypothetical protein
LVLTPSPAVTNFQTGLKEQTILVTNLTGLDASAVRVLVSGLTNQLFNAVGTNLAPVLGTNFFKPFVTYNGPLTNGQGVKLLIQIAPRGGPSLNFGQFAAYGLFASDWSAPKATGTTTNLNISRIIKLPNGNVLLEFPATAGKSYTIVYSDNGSFTNAVVAAPAVTAQANRVQWIDYGPPTTVSAPSSTPARYYRVYQNP